MLSFTPVSGKKKEREGKNVRGSREAAAMLSTLWLLSAPGSPSLESPTKFTNRKQARLKPHTSTKHPLR